MKKLDCVYNTNSRGPDWIKVKPEYVYVPRWHLLALIGSRYADQMGENLDLLVLGGWWGKGGRTGKISSLLCGLRVEQEDDGMTDVPRSVMPTINLFLWALMLAQIRYICERRIGNELRGLRVDDVSCGPQKGLLLNVQDQT